MPDKYEQNYAAGTTHAGKIAGANRRQFVIALRRVDGMAHPLSLQPPQFDFLDQALRSNPDVEIVDGIGPRDRMGTWNDGLAGAPNVLVARMADEKAAILQQQMFGQVIVERDQPLHSVPFGARPPAMVSGTALAGVPTVNAVIEVLGPNDTPIKGAEVYLSGSLACVGGITDDRGQAVLSIAGENLRGVRGLYVKPKSEYWSFYQPEPELDAHQANIVLLRPLSDSFPGLPRQQVLGWGQRAMRLDHLPGDYRGKGVRIALVDSGVATSHQVLQRINSGFDAINKKTDSATWNQDAISRGSHCAGIVAGADDASGVRGFSPDAEIHVCKLSPGGQISHLIDALEYCIEKRIDVVNLSVVNLSPDGIEPSEALEQQILRAKRLGVACIAAAGDSGGPVQYPASSPNVLAVAAIGKLGEFPPESYHSQTVSRADSAGFFSPKFTCFGPEIGVCGPGVAILSCVPPNNYAVSDGTSMAASHITGLAALVLAHHPDFRGPFQARSFDRVERLFQILKLSSQPVNLGDPRRTGFGLPDVLVALGLARGAIMGAPGPQVFAPFGLGPLGFFDPYAQLNALAYSGGAPTFPRPVVPVAGW